MTGAEILDGAAKAQMGGQIQRTAERQFGHLHPLGAQMGGAARIAADQHMLVQPGLVQGDGETLEKGLGAAVFGPGHGLQQTGHASRVSSFSAARSQVRPWYRARASAPRLARVSALLSSNAARLAKASSSGAT